jgi:hypothetical protein
MVSCLKLQYQRPGTKVISLLVYTPILFLSIDSDNESPVSGPSIGDDE